MAKARFYTVAAPGSQAIATHEETLHFALKFRQGRLERFQPWIDDDQPLGIQPIQSEAHGLPEPPLDAIAYDRRAESPRNGEADARPGAGLEPFPEAKGRK